jgi:TonB family protein
MRAIAIGLFVALIGAGLSLQSQNNIPHFEPAKVISAAEPVYPANVVNPGTVVLEVTVGETGRAENVSVVRAMPPFTEEALKAVQKWEFEPAKLDGEPIRSRVPVAFSFSRPTVWWPATGQPATGAVNP